MTKQFATYFNFLETFQKTSKRRSHVLDKLFGHLFSIHAHNMMYFVLNVCWTGIIHGQMGLFKCWVTQMLSDGIAPKNSTHLTILKHQNIKKKLDELRKKIIGLLHFFNFWVRQKKNSCDSLFGSPCIIIPVPPSCWLCLLYRWHFHNFHRFELPRPTHNPK